MDEENIVISVIITDYNRKEYIIDALKSVVGQSLSRSFYEIILVKNFKDEKIDSFASKNNVKNIHSDDITLSGKIRTGLDIARGTIICFLDDDDMFYRQKLEYVLKKFNGNNKLSYFHNNFTPVDENGNTISYYNKNPDFNMSSISVRKDIINTGNLSSVSKSMDTFMYLCALESGKEIITCNEKLTYYRITGNSVTHAFSDIESFKKFSCTSLSTILDSYNNMAKIFHSKPVIRILKHKISFTKIRMRLFCNCRAGLIDYIELFATPSLESRGYEIKVAIFSIFLKNYAIKKLYKNEMKKVEKI